MFKYLKKINKHNRIKLGSLILFFIIILILFLQFLGFGKFNQLQSDKLTNVKQTTIIYDSDNKSVANIYGSQNRINIKLNTLPKYVKYAFVCAEDTRFYSHMGFDIKRIAGAALDDIKSGRYKEGASTISQQLIKNSHLTNDKTIMRKLQEVTLSIELERRYTKDEILEMYINLIYFGNGAYGIEAASNVYFGKSAAQLTISEAALLAGVIKAPAKYAPHIKYTQSIKRRDSILDTMLEEGYITQNELKKAKTDEIKIIKKDVSYPHGFFTDMVILEAAKKLNISIEELISGGYKIYSTMDSSIQTKCEEIAASNKYSPKCQTDTPPDCSIVVIDNKTGELRAVVGGREHTTKLALNRAISVQRQPGSTIKPIIAYAPALEKGIINAATPILDDKVDFNGYSPKNFNGKFNGWITIRQALVKSLNIPAVKVFNTLGINNGKDFASELGIKFDESDDHLALTLGGMSTGTTPAEIANAYQAFGNNGQFIEYSCIREIRDNQNNTVYMATQKKKQVMTPETAFIINDILVTAVEEGTGGSLKDLKFHIAAKTGTVGLTSLNGFKDAWMASYNAQYTVVTHIGYDKTDSKHYLPQSATGSTFPADMCRDIFSYIYKNKSAPQFYRPTGIVTEQLDKKALEENHTVELATELTPASEIVQEYFAKKYIPATHSLYWNVPQTPKDIAITVENNHPVLRIKAESEYANYVVYKRTAFKDAKKFAVLSGKKDELLVVSDTEATQGEICEYYCIPEHKELKYGDKSLCGQPSQTVTIIVPYSSSNN